MKLKPPADPSTKSQVTMESASKDIKKGVRANQIHEDENESMDTTQKQSEDVELTYSLSKQTSNNQSAQKKAIKEILNKRHDESKRQRSRSTKKTTDFAPHGDSANIKPSKTKKLDIPES